MTVEPKVSWLWVVLIPAVIAGAIWWYMATDVIRQYKAQNEEMKLIWERQDLDLKMYYQRQELTEINARERDVANAPGQIPVAMPQVQ